METSPRIQIAECSTDIGYEVENITNGTRIVLQIQFDVNVKATRLNVKRTQIKKYGDSVVLLTVMAKDLHTLGNHRTRIWKGCVHEEPKKTIKFDSNNEVQIREGRYFGGGMFIAVSRLFSSPTLGQP